MASSSGPPTENDEKVWDGLPGHVSAVGKGILNFHHFIGVDGLDGSSFTRSIFLDVPLSARKTSHLAKDKIFIENARELCCGATALEKKSDIDRVEWTNLYMKAIRSQVDEAHRSM